MVPSFAASRQAARAPSRGRGAEGPASGRVRTRPPPRHRTQIAEARRPKSPRSRRSRGRRSAGPACRSRRAPARSTAADSRRRRAEFLGPTAPGVALPVLRAGVRQGAGPPGCCAAGLVTVPASLRPPLMNVISVSSMPSGASPQVLQPSNSARLFVDALRPDSRFSSGAPYGDLWVDLVFPHAQVSPPAESRRAVFDRPVEIRQRRRLNSLIFFFAGSTPRRIGIRWETTVVSRRKPAPVLIFFSA